MSAGETELSIEKWVYGGEGLARLDGQIVLAPFVMPGETVRARIVSRSPNLLRAAPLEILSRFARAHLRALPVFRPLRRLPLPALDLRIPVGAQARDSSRDAPPRG